MQHKPTHTDEEKERFSHSSRNELPAVRFFIFRDSATGQPTAHAAVTSRLDTSGIIQIQNGAPTIVEAMTGFGVRRLTYADWTKERPGELVWVGMIEGCSNEKKAAVAAIAASYIKRPYHFWNFNLGDDTGFYCSKLAWLSIFKGAGVLSR